MLEHVTNHSRITDHIIIDSDLCKELEEFQKMV
ncbi:MAG: hypothetical protein ACD_41C00135G0004 [uncultured bacterium]|nr:MAG: hypothetical protein ACD_41C00135G0004 [uncultured bacterium]